MALSLKATVDRCRAKREEIIAAIYQHAAHCHMPFSECRKRAPAELGLALDAARNALMDAEQVAIDKGRAYRGAFGMLVWTR